MQQTLGLQHVQVAHLGQVGILLDLLQQRLGLIDHDLVGLHVLAGLADVVGDLQAHHTAGLLVVMGLQAVLGLDDHADVLGLGEGAVLGGGAGHVDDALLETDDLTDGDHARAVQAMSAAAAHLAHLVQGAGENLAAAGDLHAGLQNILNRGDPAGLAGMSQLHTAAHDTLVLQDQLADLVLVDIENASLDLGLRPELHIFDVDLAKF